MLSVFFCFSIRASETEKQQDKVRLAQKTQAIIAKAKKDWPENYSMQIRQIDWEIKSMEKMDELSQMMKVPD